MHALRTTLFALLAVTLAAPTAHAVTFLYSTDLGDFEIDLFEDETPMTVDNFIDYFESGRYEDVIFHRSADQANGDGFVLQGGGFTAELEQIPTFGPLNNEVYERLSNVRGTVAMAKLGGDPDSATSQWFVNLDDNSANLDEQNGGFTVFGRVLGTGMDIVDALAALSTVNQGDPFGQLPVLDPTEPAEGGNLLQIDLSLVPDPRDASSVASQLASLSANGSSANSTGGGVPEPSAALLAATAGALWASRRLRLAA